MDGIMQTDWDGHDRRHAVSEERIAILENQHHELRDGQKEILKAVESIKSEFNRYKGIIGGITFVIGCIFTVIQIFGGYISEHWKQ